MMLVKNDNDDDDNDGDGVAGFDDDCDSVGVTMSGCTSVGW